MTKGAMAKAKALSSMANIHLNSHQMMLPTGAIFTAPMKAMKASIEVMTKRAMAKAISEKHQIKWTLASKIISVISKIAIKELRSNSKFVFPDVFSVTVEVKQARPARTLVKLFGKLQDVKARKVQRAQTVMSQSKPGHELRQFATEVLKSKVIEKSLEAYGTEVFAWGGELNSLVMSEFQDFEGVLPAGCEQTRDVSAAVGKLQDLANVLEFGAQCGLMDMTEVMQEVKQLQMQEGNHLLMMRRHNFATNLASVHVEWRQVRAGHSWCHRIPCKQGFALWGALFGSGPSP